MWVPSSDTFKNDVFPCSPLTMLWTLNPAVWAETQSALFSSGPIQITPCLLCGGETTQQRLFSRADPISKPFTFPVADRFISGHVLQPNTSNVRIQKLRTWSKFSWSANAAWVPVVSVSTCSCWDRVFHVAGERCQQSEATFERCCNRSAFQCVSTPACSPSRAWSPWDKRLLRVQRAQTPLDGTCRQPLEQ